MQTKKTWVLRDLIKSLKTAYCRNIGVEYMHLLNQNEVLWIRDQFEGTAYTRLIKEEKIKCLERIQQSAGFGTFLQQKFNTTKRFGTEGCESFIPGLKEIFDVLAENGVEKAVIGMPHRGRLNVLANVVRKPLKTIFAEFQGVTPEQRDKEWGNHGDVKYHLGTTFEREYPNGKKMQVSVLANPSHLEAVNPVVIGRVRAEQHYMMDTERERVAPILIHGDAAMAGQGVVFETMQMMDLDNYKVGGTIHIIVNNQVGFTTAPKDSRSGIYCTDLGKVMAVPIFHVNADDVEAVVKACRIAAEYRSLFKKDVLVDIIGYRRTGHNELD